MRKEQKPEQELTSNNKKRFLDDTDAEQDSDSDIGELSFQLSRTTPVSSEMVKSPTSKAGLNQLGDVPSEPMLGQAAQPEAATKRQKLFTEDDVPPSPFAHILGGSNQNQSKK